jgi:hypothetical protein
MNQELADARFRVDELKTEEELAIKKADLLLKELDNINDEGHYLDSLDNVCSVIDRYLELSEEQRVLREASHKARVKANHLYMIHEWEPEDDCMD